MEQEKAYQFNFDIEVAVVLQQQNQFFDQITADNIRYG